MATIHDLPVKSISEMTEQELIEHLRDIRLARRTAATNKNRAKKKGSKSKSKSATIDLDKLTPEQLQAVLDALEEKL